MTMLSRRRCMLNSNAKSESLLDIETARIEVVSWKNIKYTVANNELTIASGSYTWTYVKVFLDSCVVGKRYKISFKVKSDRPTNPFSILHNGTSEKQLMTNDTVAEEFTCGEKEIPFLNLAWSNGTAETIPITYYDFALTEI